MSAADQAVLEAQEILGSGVEDLESFEEQIVQKLCPGGMGEASKYVYMYIYISI